MLPSSDAAVQSATDQHNLSEVFEEFWRALDDAEEHLRIVHETAWGQGAVWEGAQLRLRRIERESLEEEIDLVLDARKRLHALAQKVAAHVIPPPGETGKQWVLKALTLGDDAYRLANEEYRRCNTYRGPMDPDLVVESYDDREWRSRLKDKLRQIEEDYRRVSSGLPEARQYLDRVLSVVQAPDAPRAAVPESTAASAVSLPATNLPQTATEPPAPPSKPAENRELAAASNITWQFVAACLEDLRLKGEAFKSQGHYAETLHCSPATVNKAIQRTPTLAEWAQRPVSSTSSALSIEGAVLDKVPQRRECDPADTIEQPDIDAAMAYLLDQAAPEERAKIHAMSPAEKRRLAEIAYRDPDRESQILERDTAPHSR